jgi:hypothetical protein
MMLSQLLASGAWRRRRGLRGRGEAVAVAADRALEAVCDRVDDAEARLRDHRVRERRVEERAEALLCDAWLERLAREASLAQLREDGLDERLGDECARGLEGESACVSLAGARGEAVVGAEAMSVEETVSVEDEIAAAGAYAAGALLGAKATEESAFMT